MEEEEEEEVWFFLTVYELVSWERESRLGGVVFSFGRGEGVNG